MSRTMLTGWQLPPGLFMQPVPGLHNRPDNKEHGPEIIWYTGRRMVGAMCTATSLLIMWLLTLCLEGKSGRRRLVV